MLLVSLEHDCSQKGGLHKRKNSSVSREALLYLAPAILRNIELDIISNLHSFVFVIAKLEGS
jgi:hypothetical protein